MNPKKFKKLAQSVEKQLGLLTKKTKTSSSTSDGGGEVVKHSKMKLKLTKRGIDDDVASENRVESGWAGEGEDRRIGECEFQWK